MGHRAGGRNRSRHTPGERRARSIARRALRRWLPALAVGYVVLCAALVLLQRHILFPADGRDPGAPRGAAYQTLRDVTIETEDGLELRAWHWPGRREVTIVVFHGQGQNRSTRLDWIEGFHRRGFGVLLLDYRGYGGSEGSPSEEGLYRDGEAAIGWLEERDRGPLVYLGESLGSAVAVEMAVRHPPEVLIIQSGFPSAVALGARKLPFLPVSLFLRDRFESVGKVRNLRCPVLQIHGDDDGVVPLELALELYEELPEPKELFIARGVDHNDLVAEESAEYYERVAAFIAEHVDGPEPPRDSDRAD